jgi:DNA-binding MarR family transcriptional regulator
MDWVDEMLAALRAESPEAVSVSLEFVKRVGRLSALIQESTDEALSVFDTTYAEFDVLATLRRSGTPYRLKPTQLAKSSMLSSGGTSNILQRLTTAGLVEREPDPDDGRSSWVRLTAEGAKLAADIGEATGAAFGARFRDVPADTLRAAADQLREILLTLGDRAPSGTGS